MTKYEEIRKRVSNPMYVSCKPEGKAAHPDWYGVGCNPTRGLIPDEQWDKQLDAYIKAVYGIEK